MIFLNFFPTQFHRLEYTFFALLILTLGVSQYEGHSIWIRTPLDWPILLLLSWILLTIPFAVDPVYSFSEWRKLAVQFLVFYWALLVLQRQSKKPFFYFVGIAVLVGACSLSSFAVWDFVDRGGTLMNREVRALAPSSHSPWLATYLVMSWPIVLFLIIKARSLWQRSLLISILVFLGIAEILSFSRGAWIAIACQIGFGAFLMGKKKMGLGAVLGILLCLIGLWWISQQGYLGDIFDKKSAIDRLGCWKLGIVETLSNPILGVGFGNDTFAKIYPGDPPGECGIGISLPAEAHLHNTPLMVAMGSGVPALVLLVWVFVKAVKVLLNGVKVPTVMEEGGFRVAIAILVIGFWICSFFDILFTGSLANLFLILLAVGISLAGHSILLGNLKK